MDKSKRKFLKSAILITPLIGAGYYFSNISYEKLIKKAIHTRLHYLELDADGVDLFAKDYAELVNKSKITVISIDLAVSAKGIFPGFTKLNERVNTYEDYLIIKFLESSDFFFNGSDESKPVKYLGINQTNPYIALCTNPFADLSYD
ncbi:MAG: hypothetical protein QNL62_14035 [Gammaproteobacteria bacterium]|nr:hypothetical protein [Gammaproteobacteria bacterium]